MALSPLLSPLLSCATARDTLAITAKRTYFATIDNRSDTLRTDRYDGPRMTMIEQCFPSTGAEIWRHVKDASHTDMHGSQGHKNEQGQQAIRRG